MKTLKTYPFLVGSLALAAGILLSSCADPYSQGYGPQHSVATYRVGYEVRSLPSGYRTEVIDGNNYYNYNGTYYRSHSGRYVVVEAPRRSQYRPRYDRPTIRKEVIITQLPRGYRQIDRRGVRYYQVNDTFYQKRDSGYIIVSRPN